MSCTGIWHIHRWRDVCLENIDIFGTLSINHPIKYYICDNLNKFLDREKGRKFSFVCHVVLVGFNGVLVGMFTNVATRANLSFSCQSQGDYHDKLYYTKEHEVNKNANHKLEIWPITII